MLGDKIRQIRIEKGLSESELARQSGHAVSTIHGIENGDNENPGFKLIGDIAKVLGVLLDTLYQQLDHHETLYENDRPTTGRPFSYLRKHFKDWM